METIIIFNRQNGFTYIIVELDDNLNADEFAWTLEDALILALVHPHHFFDVKIKSMEIEDVPENMQEILQKIGTSLCCKIKIYHGYRRRRVTPRPWSKKIKRIAKVVVGKYKGNGNYSFYEELFIRFYFKRIPTPLFLS